MNIVITMAGLGTRFRNAGYVVPKFEIEVFGKSLFQWSMSSLSDFFTAQDHYIFIVQQKDNADVFIRDECEKLGIVHFDILSIDYLTDGQATTVMLAKPLWNAKAELLIYNIDTYVESGQMKRDILEADGFIPCFSGEGTHWSFVKLGTDGNAIEVREKQKISDHCTIGAYYFKTAAMYEDAYLRYYEDNELDYGEKYVAPLYNDMIQHGRIVKIFSIPSDKVHVLGTPEELTKFETKYRNRE